MAALKKEHIKVQWSGRWLGSRGYIVVCTILIPISNHLEMISIILYYYIKSIAGETFLEEDAADEDTRNVHPMRRFD